MTWGEKFKNVWHSRYGGYACQSTGEYRLYGSTYEAVSLNLARRRSFIEMLDNIELSSSSFDDEDNWRWIVGQNYLGRQVIVCRNGKVSLNFEAFWVYTGSYFNARYYYSGIAAYGGRNYTAREWMNISATNVGGNISDYTGVSGTVASSTAGVAGMTKASAQLSEQTQFKYGKRVNGTIKSAKTLSQENAIVMGKIAKGARFAGNALGVVSLVDHSAQAYDAFNQDDYINGWINVGKASIDVGLMFIKSNPFVLGISVVYNISDAAGLLEY